MAKAKKSTNPSVKNLDGENVSKKELETKRKEITSYYEENIPHLKIQKEYEELLRDIEKTRAERLQAQMFIAQTMAAPPEDGEEMPSEMKASFDTSQTSGEEAAEQIKRTLKRQTNDV
tara:strand:- start:7342 stop:7695 length:354 start_codon:yes stop_codon:yes gene_type:complete